MPDFTIPGIRIITGGDYFVFKGERYGRGTKFRLNKRGYARNGITIEDWEVGKRKEEFYSLGIENGKQIWYCGFAPAFVKKFEIDPETDIYGITNPVYYLTPDELMKQRLKDGSWMHYIGPQTLFYLFCLLVSPLFKEWYLIWTIGLYIYLRTSYITLRKP